MDGNNLQESISSRNDDVILTSMTHSDKISVKDTPKDTPQATPASRRKSDVKITNWVIGYLDEKEKFRSDFKLKGFVHQVMTREL